LDLCDLLAVDAKDRNTAIAVVIPGIFIVGPTVNGSDCYIALGREGKPLWCVTDHNSVNDARRLRFKIDDVDGIDTNIRIATIAGIRSERDVTTRCDGDVVWPQTGQQIEFGVSYLVAINV